ncbi:MAG: methionine adenosyltransferase [Euryarchaeota archaeon]|nr:methionine adenosyltransferase [Euryarchaeota archaeon]
MGRGGSLFSSESVTCGHPDKLCDAISDTIVDACLKIDPDARVAVETLVKGMRDKSVIMLAGEVTISSNPPNYEQLARDAASEIGYNNHKIGMDATSQQLCDVQVNITTQAANIAQGVDRDGAGDQGIMFGFACKETERFSDLEGRYFPLAAALSQRVTRRLRIVRELPEDDSSYLGWARPDGKSQVTVEYDANGTPSRVHTVIVAIQHDSNLKDRFDGDEVQEHAFIKSEIIEHVIRDAIPSELLDENTIFTVNGTGRFADPAGPYADAGLTGRKVIVDTYGGMGRHGGGAFSGKDPSKVDRSAAYAARWAAKHVVAAGLADRCEIQLAYVIGVAEPVSIRVETFDTSVIPEDEIAEKIKQVFDFTPRAIIVALDLLRPIYSSTASGGHFGRTPGVDGEFPWEVLDAQLIEALST